MKICITASSNSVESALDPRFGRTPYFIIMDTDKKDLEILENSAAISGSGAGIASGQLIIDKGVEVVITGSLGPNAMHVLQAAGIKAYQGTNKSVQENIHDFTEGLLKEIDTTAAPHSGMGQGRGRNL